MSGIARFVGSVTHEPDSIWSVMYPGDIELYRLDPPLSGYSVVAAAASPWAMHPQMVGDPPQPREDPVCTYLFGVAGGEGLQIQWHDHLLKTGGRTPSRALADSGYRVHR